MSDHVGSAVSDLFGWAKFPPELALGITVAILAVDVAASMRWTCGRSLKAVAADRS